jgi:hypothetical protein
LCSRSTFHLISLAAAAFVEHGALTPVLVRTSDTPIQSFFKKIKVSDQVPVEVPGLFLTFTDDLDDDEIDKLNSLGFYCMETATGEAGFCKLHPDDTDVEFCISIAQDLSSIARLPKVTSTSTSSNHLSKSDQPSLAQHRSYHLPSGM